MLNVKTLSSHYKVITRFFKIRTSQFGPEAQMFLMSTDLEAITTDVVLNLLIEFFKRKYYSKYNVKRIIIHQASTRTLLEKHTV